MNHSKRPILRLFVTLPLLVIVASSCSSSDPIGEATASLAEQLKTLGDGLGSNIALLKSAAVTAGTFTPADLVGVAHIVQNLTGGTDISAALKGTTGDQNANVDGVVGDEAVTIFVPDPPSGGTGTTVSSPSYISWKARDDSSNKGLCYLAWTKGESWFVISKCGNTNGAYVCQGGDSAVCNACNVAGQCNPCDLSQSSFTCAWP